MKNSTAQSKLYLVGILSMVLIIYSCSTPKEKKSKEGYEIEKNIFEDVDKLVEDINSRLHYLQVKKIKVPTIKGSYYSSQYVITVKDQHMKSVFFFDIYEYTMVTGGDPTAIPTSEICSIIEELYDRPEPIFELVRKLQVNGSLTAFKFLNLEIENIQEVVVELLYSIRKFYDLRTKQADIFVKGYADGETSSWQKQLMPYPYNYTNVDYHPTLNVGSLNPVSYSTAINSMTITSGFYKNIHLPNLRANFVSKDLILPFLNSCSNLNPKVSVIEGFEFRTPNQPLNRKAQVFIMLNEKK